MVPLAGQKRKVDYNPPGTLAQARKRQKGEDARAIPSQTADAALSTSGELNIASFIKAREFEIAALDSSMKKARKNLSARAFQQVPRHMRRRTASHNVKKIPRRLRARAAREMIEDNTPTGSARKRKPSAKLRLRLETAKRLQNLNAIRQSGRLKKQQAKLNAKESDPEKHILIQRIPRIKKDKLAQPPQAISKYKRRQVNKTWLPTHVWHTKRAHMTRPTLPLWRMAIALQPNEKSYRATHRAAGSRGCIAWDMSYISTAGCQGTEAALEAMLKALGFAGEGWSGAKFGRWKAGTRHSTGWLFDTHHDKRPIAPATVIWQVQATQPPANAGQNDQMEAVMADSGQESATPKSRKHRLNRRLFIRIHPSAFHQFWTELLKAAKTQKPQVLVEDLRFEIGSIDVQGPGSTEALCGVLNLHRGQPYLTKLWSLLPSLNNPSALPQGAILAFDATDPRLNHPPRQIPVSRDDQSLSELNEMIVSWTSDTCLPTSNLFDYKIRYRTSKSLPSQKAINRRRRELLHGQHLESAEADPKIPMILLAHRSPSPDTSCQGSWTLLLPWACTDIVWRSLMYYPLTSGSTPRFGGLEQVQQVASETSTPWYPADFPGTEAGKAWDRTESEKRFDRWTRRPTSKRFAWDALDLGLGRKGELGRGWCCDWEYLFSGSVLHISNSEPVNVLQPNHDGNPSTHPAFLTQRQRKEVAAPAGKAAAEQALDQTSNANAAEPDRTHNDVKYTQLEPSQASSILKNYKLKELPHQHGLVTIRLRLLTKGTPKAAARIYRLPNRAPSEAGAVTNQSQPSNEPSGPAAASSNNQPIGKDMSKPTAAWFKETSTNHTACIDNEALRRRWLALDSLFSFPNPNSSTKLRKPLPKEHRNRHGDIATHQAYNSKHTMDLSHIRVFPPRETKPQVLNMFGPKPLPMTAEQRLKTLQPEIVPRLIMNKDGELVEEGLWDRHVPCPGPEDLIGYVTSGGYNLVEGRGTAIGAIWVQRITEGWKAEDEAVKSPKASNVTNGESRPTGAQQAVKGDAGKMKVDKQVQKQVDRERHLCIVRNAGESIGRLGLWERC